MATDANTTKPNTELGSTTEVDPPFSLGEQLGTISDWLPGAAQPYWQAVEQYPLIGALIIVVLGYIIARMAVRIVRSAVHQLTRRTQTTIDDRLFALFARPLFLTLFFYTLSLAIRSIDSSGRVTEAIVKILASLVILSWMNALMPAAKLVLEALGKYKGRFDLVEERTIPLFNILSSILLIGVAAYALLIVWGINPAAWLASAGVLGIAVGFAAKDTLANLFSGVFIVADSPYKIGDYINLDGGERGMVTHVGLRSTRLITRDDVEITIPNAIIANTKIINESGGASPRSRIRIKVGVAYGSDIDQVIALLEDIAFSHTVLCGDPKPRVRLRGFGDSSVDLELLGWIVEPSLRGLVSHELYVAIYKRFNKEGIEIPYPKRDLYLKEMPPRDETAT